MQPKDSGVEPSDTHDLFHLAVPFLELYPKETVVSGIHKDVLGVVYIV